jgi:thiamine-phosphate pyrophosphorylase
VILHAVVADLETARAAIEGGATVVQLRLKGVPTAALVERGRPFRELCARRGISLVVNDDVAAAVELGADGVHLGRRDVGIERAREAGLLLGLSASDLGEARGAALEGADYIGAGPVWKTPTKPEAGLPIGLEGLRTICAAVAPPVIAIGGIDAGNAGACLDAGAAGVAVVRAARQARALRAALDRAAV